MWNTFWFTFTIYTTFGCIIAAGAVTAGLIRVAVAHLTLMCGTIAFFAVFRLALSNTLAAAAFLIWVAAANFTFAIYTTFAIETIAAAAITAGLSIGVAAVTTAAILSVRTGFSGPIIAAVRRIRIITSLVITAITGAATGTIAASLSAAAIRSTAAGRIT